MVQQNCLCLHKNEIRTIRFHNLTLNLFYHLKNQSGSSIFTYLRYWWYRFCIHHQTGPISEPTQSFAKRRCGLGPWRRIWSNRQAWARPAIFYRSNALWRKKKIWTSGMKNHLKLGDFLYIFKVYSTDLYLYKYAIQFSWEEIQFLINTQISYKHSASLRLSFSFLFQNQFPRLFGKNSNSLNDSDSPVITSSYKT